MIKKGTKEEHSFPLEGKVVSIGSHRANDIQLDDSAHTISRFHAALFPDPNGNYHLQDLGSKNNFLVNGHFTPCKILEPGDEIAMGDDFTLVFQNIKGVKGAKKKSKTIRICSEENGTPGSYDTRLLPSSSFTDNLSKLEKSPKKLALLYRLNQEIQGSSMVESVLQDVLEKVMEATGAERGFIAHGPSIDNLEFLAGAPREVSVIKSRTLINRVFLKGETLFTRDAVSDTCFEESKSVFELGIRSAVGVPLKGSRGVNGLLYLDSTRAPGLFSEDDLLFLSLLGRDITFAMRREEERENQSLGFESKILGMSPPARELVKTIEKVAPYPASVIITGETGVGKELVARAIHKASDRKGNFVEFNSAAMPETLIESELFGYISGSHSTAFQDKKGLFESASGGTLFLDEIGDMALATQAKVLKAIDENEIRRLGATEATRIDTRIIAATNKNLVEEIQKGIFRNDLYQRLRVVEIQVPPLRKRKDDIPILAGFFICRFRNRFNKDVGRLSRETIDLLRRYSWPGNIRELENVIEGTLIHAAKTTLITPKLLKKNLFGSHAVLKTMEEMEVEHILNILEHTGGNKEKALKILGISKQTLYNKGKRHSLPGFVEETGRVNKPEGL